MSHGTGRAACTGALRHGHGRTRACIARDDVPRSGWSLPRPRNWRVERVPCWTQIHWAAQTVLSATHPVKRTSRRAKYRRALPSALPAPRPRRAARSDCRPRISGEATCPRSMRSTPTSPRYARGRDNRRPCAPQPSEWRSPGGRIPPGDREPGPPGPAHRRRCTSRVSAACNRFSRDCWTPAVCALAGSWVQIVYMRVFRRYSDKKAKHGTRKSVRKSYCECDLAPTGGISRCSRPRSASARRPWAPNSGWRGTPRRVRRRGRVRPVSGLTRGRAR